MRDENLYTSHNLATAIKRQARLKNVVIKEMLDYCDLGSNTMSAMYHGRSIAFDSLAKIADYLGVSVDFLLGRTDSEQCRKGGESGANAENRADAENGDMPAVCSAEEDGELPSDDVRLDELICLFNAVPEEKKTAFLETAKMILNLIDS